MVNLNFEECEVNSLDNSVDNYNPNEVDVFHDEQLGACTGFPMPEGRLPILKLRHVGSDGWQGDWIRFLLDDGTYLECPLNVWLDDDQVYNVDCDGGEK